MRLLASVWLTVSSIALSAVGCGNASHPSMPASMPAKLAFNAAPGDAMVGQPFPTVQVTVLDAGGTMVVGDTSPITLALGANPGGATLSGNATAAATSGVATFSGLTIDKPGAGYALSANSGTLIGAMSGSFRVSQQLYSGFYTDQGDSTRNVSNYLLGSAITVTEPMRLERLGLVARAAGANVKIALYTDNGGKPDQLVAATGSTPLVIGRLEVPVTETVLAAGTYWFMAVYDTTASVGYSTAISAVVRYLPVTYANSIPTTWPVWDYSYIGGAFNYYLVALVP